MTTKRIPTGSDFSSKSVGRGNAGRISRGNSGQSNKILSQSGKVSAPMKAIPAESSASEASDETLLVLHHQQPFALDMNPLRAEPGLFRDEADYERVTNSVAARIRAGEIESCEPEGDEK